MSLLPTQSLTDQLCDSVLRRFLTLRDVVRELESHLPPFGAKRFAGKVLQEIERDIRDLTIRIGEAKTLPELECVPILKGIIQAYGLRARNLQELDLPFLAQEPRHGLPVELVPSLRSISKDFAPNFEISLESWCESNFQFTCRFASNPKSTQLEPIILLSLPRIQERDALHHPLLLHEIGHLFDYAKNVSMNQTLNWHLSQTALNSIVGEIVSLIADQSALPAGSGDLDAAVRAVTDNQLRNYLSTAGMQTLESWVREFAADAFAVRVCGPAYFFALADFSFSNEDPARHSDTHPASSKRLQRMMCMLEKMGYLSETAYRRTCDCDYSNGGRRFPKSVMRDRFTDWSPAR
jgi:hypothetical protein